MSGLKLFNTQGGVTEVVPRLAEVEADIQCLVEAHMETMLGVRFLASEYSTGPVHGGRTDSLGIDENGAPVVVEYKRGTDAGVINQGLFYLSWLMDHRAEFGHLVRDRLGATAASQVLWSAPRLICVAGDFTRYDIHAVREHRRSIDLVRYRLFGHDHIGLETVASHTGQTATLTAARRRAVGVPSARRQDGALTDLAAAVDEALLGLGDGITRIQRKQYRAYQRLRNFACVCPPQKTKLLVYLKADPRQVDLVPGFTRDVTGLGHHGTGDLEVQLRTLRDVERAQELFGASYAAAQGSTAGGMPCGCLAPLCRLLPAAGSETSGDRAEWRGANAIGPTTDTWVLSAAAGRRACFGVGAAVASCAEDCARKSAGVAHRSAGSVHQKCPGTGQTDTGAREPGAKYSVKSPAWPLGTIK